MKIPVFVLMGRAGVGKSVVGDQYSTGKDIPIIHVGDELRSLGAAGHPIASRVREMMLQTKRYDPTDVTAVLKEIIGRDPQKFSKGIIIDGFPRWVEAIPVFEAFLKENNLALRRVIYFHAPKKDTRKRQLIRKRESAEIIKRREADFDRFELEVVNYYKQRGLVRIIRSMEYKSPNKKAFNYAIPLRARALNKIIGAGLKIKR
jgi:adenylate kinase family enzyme